MDKKSSYIFSADVVRTIAILGVVSIHIANAVYTRVDFFGGTTWWLTIVLDSFSRVSIPFFILLSGFLILGKDESFEKSLKRIVYRIVIPLFFWFVFYVWYGGGLPSMLHFNSEILPKLFYGNMYHLYFLVIIVGLYFAAPIIRSFLKNTPPKSSDFFMKILLLIGCLMIALQFIFQACGTENFFTKWIPYTGLFVVGYMLGNKSSKFSSKKLLFFYSIGLTATIAGNYIQYFFASNNINLLASKGCLSHYTDHYLSLNVVLMSVSAFILLLNLKFIRFKNNVLTKSIIQTIAKASFGIYVIHPFVARFLETQFNLAVDFSTLPIVVIILSRLILVFLISYCITVLALRIPVVRMLFGGR